MSDSYRRIDDAVTSAAKSTSRLASAARAEAASEAASAAASAAATAADTALNAVNNIRNKLGSIYSSISGMVSPGGLFFVFLVIAILGYLFVTQSTLHETQKKSINTVETARKLQSIKQDAHEYPLRNFYIKTALNCCCLGEWKNGYVDMSALHYAIAQGYRCLDFEIYSLNDSPIVGASSQLKNFRHTESFNHLDFMEVCKQINERAFSIAPNSNDPLLINLRIKSDNPNKELVKRIIDCIKQFGDRLLEPEYNYEFGGQNLGMIPIKKFMGKVIIMVDVSNPVVKNGCNVKNDAAYCLHQYINIGSTSPFMHVLNYELQVKNAPNMQELIEHNKKYMSIVFPDPPFETNVNFHAAKIFGCQLVGMMPLIKDDNLKKYNQVFAEAGTAFKLKPPELCYQPVVIETPKPQNPELSFASRNYKTDYAAWKG
jgi:peptidyl-tRNA hydrolase